MKDDSNWTRAVSICIKMKFTICNVIVYVMRINNENAVCQMTTNSKAEEFITFDEIFNDVLKDHSINLNERAPDLIFQFSSWIRLRGLFIQLQILL